MRRAATGAALVSSALALLAAVWLPGAWWQWLATSAVLFLVGVGISISGDSAPTPPPARTVFKGERRD